MKKFLSALLATAVASTLHLAHADNSMQEYNLEIARQSLEETLKEFSKQTGLNTAFVRKSWNQPEIIVGPLKGRYTAAEALSALLADTGLTFKQTNEFSISVAAREAASSTPESSAWMTKAAKGKFLHLTESQFLDEVSADAGVQRIATVKRPEETEASKEVSRNRSIEEMIVAGSHIRGVQNKTVPVIVLDRAYIDATGLSTTTQLIESLPQNFALASQSGTAAIPGNDGATLQGSSVNLRGVGQGTTLVLLNGRRMAAGFFGRAADISALPLSAIERVEVLTDGASALYGSDAIGGVINFVLKSDFAGAETRLRSGWADGGVNEYRLDQSLGTAWDSGTALLSLEYYKRDLLLAQDRDWTPSGSLNSLLPRDENYSAVFSGQQHLSGALMLFADALYTRRDTLNFGSRDLLNRSSIDGDNSQLSATLGADWQIGGDWQVEAAGSYGRNKVEQTSSHTRAAIFSNPMFEIRASQLKADGSVFSLPGGKVSLAVGAEWRTESFRYAAVNLLTGARLAEGNDSDQIIRSAFGELYVPIVGASNAVTGARRVELSLAGRFDDYSNFGSSFDPQVGIMWEPIDGLRLRANRGSSYKAPNLQDYNTSGNSAIAAFIPNPGGASFPGLPSGLFQLMQVVGADPALSPQKAQSLSLGVEFIPASIQGLQLGLNYYKIEYTDQIAVPGGSSGVLLRDPSGYGSLTFRDPSVALVNEFIASAELGQGFFALNPDFTPNTNFTPDSVDVIVDLRSRNLSVMNTRGLDVSMQYDFDVAGADVHLGLTATHISRLVERVTATSAPRDTVDTIFNPPDWRVRGSMGLQRQRWAANLFVNYTDSYVDNRRAALVPVSSYTTVDARLAYDFKGSVGGSFLSGVSISTFVQNLFDTDPPRTATIDSISAGFDPTNANPMGRFVGVEVSKSW